MGQGAGGGGGGGGAAGAVGVGGAGGATPCSQRGGAVGASGAGGGWACGALDDPGRGGPREAGGARQQECPGEGACHVGDAPPGDR